ncbi:hypothetical protein C0992_007358 [Termitomyces sp. T32_za158]|nr:hypothetical protein C0992_007358 [Termitomyces sp. T32_za158]
MLMNLSTSSKPEIIDLTGPEYEVSSKATSALMMEQENKKPRRRKRKRTEGDSTPSLAPTRDASPVEREIEMKMIDTAHDDPDDPLNEETNHRKERRSNKRREQKTVSSSSTSSRLKDLMQEDLFFVDLEPVPFTAASQTPSTSTFTSEKATELLLPAHVSVFGEGPAELIAPEDATPDEEFIEFLDFDDNSKVRVSSVVHARSHANLIEYCPLF